MHRMPSGSKPSVFLLIYVVEFVYEVILSILRIEMKKKKQNINGFIQKLILSVFITCTDNLLPHKNTTLLAKQLLPVLAIMLGIISIAAGTISTTVFLRDSNTPLELVDPNIPHVYRDIMVGTKLKIVVSSDDTSEYWAGDLGLEEAYWPYGILTPRDPLPAAGDFSYTSEQEESGIKWINLNGGYGNVEVGDWFIIDYNAVDAGDFNIVFYDYNISWDPNYYICFSNVRSRDFNYDTIVNFQDYGILLNHWSETDCIAPNWCEGTDLDANGYIDINDLMLFCEFWLERTK